LRYRMKSRIKPSLAGVLAIVCVVVLCPLVFRKHTISLFSGGRVVAVARRWLSDDVDVYVGKSKLFTLDSSFFEFPVLVLPLDGGKRFLCIYDNDVQDLVFVVDAAAPTNAALHEVWVPYVVKDTRATVRLPTQAELDGAAAALAAMTPKQFKRVLIPCLDIGVHRWYWPKEAVLPLLRAVQRKRWEWCSTCRIGAQPVNYAIQGDTFEGSLDESNRRILFVILWKASGDNIGAVTEDGRGRLTALHGHDVQASFSERAVYALQRDYRLRRLVLSDLEQTKVFDALMKHEAIEADSFWTEKVLAKLESVQPQQTGSAR